MPGALPQAGIEIAPLALRFIARLAKLDHVCCYRARRHVATFKARTYPRTPKRRVTFDRALLIICACAPLQNATRRRAIPPVYVNARFSSRRASHLSWSCKRAGLPEISANILSALLETKSMLSNSALGTAKLVLTFVMPLFE